MHNYVLKNGFVVDTVNLTKAKKDVLIRDGMVAEVGENLSADETIDCTGMLISPGLIDIHTHLREPGFEHKETIETATKAAAAGGFTTIYAMPNTEPPCDDETMATFIKKRAESVGLVNVEPVGCISQGRKGEFLAEMGGLAKAGVVMVTDDGSPVASANLMLLALKYSKAFGLLVADHCEDKSLSGKGVCNEGYHSTLYGLHPSPKSAEETMVARDLILAHEADSRIHIQHVSTNWSLELIKQSKGLGTKVTCEVTPHHLTMTDEMLGSYDPNCKVNPPLRTKEDVEALRQGLIDGSIDCIATDHAPHAREDKEVEIDIAPPGITGLETAIGQLFTELVHTNIISVEVLLSKMTTGPATVMGIEVPEIKTGKKADITIINPEKEWTVDPKEFYSLGKNTPLAGKKMKGKVFATIVSGKVVYKDGKIG
ncbi:MAG TPA: dihydroorotase [Caldisericia bacterium]|nr:dihydroorotase [Caldisericia bacterium]HPF48210.1 dihydroorotase [Caldisericia bacterium]HPI83854.1 dihydroorotase [Caldisericia bacterium]HPQ92663.1 dihydroorotase [Caldisericia bacterium]HRV74239.1 dihydroorotase [Caldisericia bacterium]